MQHLHPVPGVAALLLAGILGGTLAAAPAAALQLTTGANVQSNLYDASIPGTHHAEISRNVGGHRATAEAAAGGGFLSGGVEVLHPGSGFTFGRATASFLIDDIVITAEEGLPQVIDLVLQVSVGYSEEGITAGDLTILAGINTLAGDATFFSSGFATTITRVATVDISQPVSVRVALDLNAAISGAPALGSSGVLVHLGGSPVFLFPEEGYTANSVDGQIVDNFYVGPVPEPTTTMLLGAGLLVLAAKRRARVR